MIFGTAASRHTLRVLAYNSMKMQIVSLTLAVMLLTGCSGRVGHYVGGKDRCLTYAFSGCALRVNNGIVQTGSTIDMYNNREVLIDASPRESAARHAYDAVSYSGGMFIGESRRDPKEAPLLH